MPRLIPALGLVMVIVACDSTGPNLPALAAPDSAAVMVDSTVDLGASVSSTAPLTWASLDTLTATVDSSGNVTGHLPGTARVVVAADTISRTIQVRVMIRIAAVDYGACTRSADGLVFCHGRRMNLPRNLRMIAPSTEGSSGCALTTGGEAWCWGTIPPGNGTDSSFQPVAVPGHSFHTITSGTYHHCGAKNDGTIWCWGRSAWHNMTSQFPHGSNVLVPQQVAAGRGYVSLVAGFNHACALSLLRPYCWGENWADAIGARGNPGQCSEPCVDTASVVTLDSALVTLATTHGHTCGLTVSGQAWCWGANGWGQLGDSTWTGCAFLLTDCSTVPQPVNTAIRFNSITVGWHHACALTDEGNAWCWGRNDAGQVGSGSAANGVRVPEPVAGNHVFQSLSSAPHGTCGIAADGAWCWGGSGLTAPRVPVRLPNQP